MLVFSGEGDLEVPESIHTSRPTERFFLRPLTLLLLVFFACVCVCVMCVLCVVLLACRKSCPSLLLAQVAFHKKDVCDFLPKIPH